MDLRVVRGRIWNVKDVLHRFPVGTKADQWNLGLEQSDESWIDEFVYRGFRAHGEPFLAALEGRFAILYLDAQRNVAFLARDWIGELPMHVLATAEALWIANTISSLRDAAGDEYLYSHIRAFPQAAWQEICLREARPGQIDLTMRPGTPETYYQFRVEVARIAALGHLPKSRALKAGLLSSVTRRAHPGRKAALLLSGGLDSLSVALVLRSVGVEFEAYTLSMGEPEPNGDPDRAIEYARRLGVEHHLVTVRAADVIQVVEEAIRVSESYHLYNVYCAAGMILLARRLKATGCDYAFCGEGFNEAVGDYKDWVIIDPRNGREIVLQYVNAKKLSDREQRMALVWGPGRDHGRYNHQLGAGLAKHAGARMFKPFLAYGLELEAPLLDRHFLSHVVAIEGEVLRSRGGKPWLVESMFSDDLRRIGISEADVMSAPKVRLQDSGRGGRGGISPKLYGAGFDQRKVLEMFNTFFAAKLQVDVEVARLKGVRHGAL